MALNPTDIDVTNQFLITHMTEKQLKELESSESGLPENAIITTSDIDENISCLRTEVVYDMTSSDASKNWGYTSGIRNNVTVTGKDFSKYEKLIAYCYTNYYTYPVEIDLTKHTVENFYLSRLCIGKADSMLYFAGGQTNLEKTSFTARIFRVNNTTNMSTEYDEDSFYVYKIEGILKTPSMIYTGDALTAGNGISIANGVISNITNILSSYYNRKPSAITTTSSIDITTGTFTKKSATSKIIVLASAYIQDSTGGYGSGLRVNIDGSEAVSSISNASKEHCILCPISNRASGNHTFSLQLIAGAGSATIPSYNDIYFTFLEVE